MRLLWLLGVLLVVSGNAAADCAKDGQGNVVCGAGQCELDQYGAVYCAAPGGGAMKDQYGNVVCGAGYCTKDSSGEVWCSKKAGGGAATDAHGKARCYGGCEAATAGRCEAGRT